MSSYTPAELLRKWSRGELTADQAIGHLMQQVQTQEQRLAQVEKRLRQLEQAPAKPQG